MNGPHIRQSVRRARRAERRHEHDMNRLRRLMTRDWSDRDRPRVKAEIAALVRSFRPKVERKARKARNRTRRAAKREAIAGVTLSADEVERLERQHE